MSVRQLLRDDLGRFLQRFGDDVRVLRYCALAEEDELHWLTEWQATPHGSTRTWKQARRAKGEPLFPEHKSLAFLNERRKLLTRASWEALYQQNPMIVGGGELPIEKLTVLQYFDRSKIVSSVRYWDKAADTSDDAAYTAGVLMHKLSDHSFVIEHVARGRWNARDREARIKATAKSDSKFCRNYKIYVEQEPGSSGKESAENTIRNLMGYRVFADKVTGSKEVRAQPFASQVQGDNVRLIAGNWVSDFLDECETWPNGKYKDQVDAAAGAFNKLTTYFYDTSYDWV